MIILDIEQGSDEWKELRRNKITATDAGIIMGLNPWTTPYQLWQRKLGLIEEQEVNDKMREGSLMEEEARNFFNKPRYEDFSPIVALHSENEWAMASFDGLNGCHDILEIKCGKKSYEQAKEGIIPDYYMSQLQHQIYIADHDRASYFCYISRSQNVLIVVKRDDAFIEKMIEAEKKFFDCLMNFSPPPLTDRDFTVRTDPHFIEKADKYSLIKRERQRLEQEEDALRDELIRESGGLSVKVSGLTISKSPRRGNIEYNAIPELKSIDLNKYRKKSIEVWTVRES